MMRALTCILAFSIAYSTGCGQHLGRTRKAEDVSPKQAAKAAQSFTSESDFLQKAARDERAQIELGQLAQSKAQRPEVKAFAQQMVTEHTQMLSDLEKLAASANVSVPSDLDSSQSELKSTLQSQSGKDFDKNYVNAEARAHEQMVNLLEGAVQKAQNPTVKDFATVKLITERDHLDAAQALAKKV
ncbi:MAG: putative outer membrane protein [Candidatus Angelobacter sp.]|nr:putative outer membrane protein [Candidatus Angelobacter sp.]